jgi:hypothetical protein
MGNDECKPVSVSRRIEAPASVIFRLLAHPDKHPDFDGSAMPRTGASNESSLASETYSSRRCTSPQWVTTKCITASWRSSTAWEPGNPELARNGSRWRFDLTPDGPNATVVTETYDCTESPESVRKAVDNGNAWMAGMTKTLEQLDQLCATQ